MGSPRKALFHVLVLLVALGLLGPVPGCQERTSGPRTTGPQSKARESRDVAWLQSTHAKILVFDDGPYRCLAFGSRAGVQSCVHRTNRLDFRYEYVRMFFAVTALVERPRRMLVLGLGGAAVPTLLETYFPKARIDVVEIDGGVFTMAKKYLYYQPTSRTRVHIEDAAKFVARAAGSPTGQRYDIVFVDCYDGVHIPPHLLSDKFIRGLRSVLTPRGVVAANFWSTHRSYPTSIRQLHTLFADVWRIPGHRSTNHIVVASPRRLTPTPDEMRARGGALEKRLAPPFLLSTELKRLVRLKRPAPARRPPAK